MCTVWAVTRVVNAEKSSAKMDCQRQIKTKYEPAIYMFEETAEIGVYQVNYGKPSYCNKNIRRDFNESFHF